MEILEFENKENKKNLLIHGFQSPYQVWNKYIIKCLKGKGHCENSIMNPGLMIKEMDHVLI